MVYLRSTARILDCIRKEIVIMKISKFIKSILSNKYPNTNWNCNMSVKLVNHILKFDYKGEYYISLDDNNNQALYERDY